MITALWRQHMEQFYHVLPAFAETYDLFIYFYFFDFPIFFLFVGLHFISSQSVAIGRKKWSFGQKCIICSLCLNFIFIKFYFICSFISCCTLILESWKKRRKIRSLETDKNSMKVTQCEWVELTVNSTELQLMLMWHHDMMSHGDGCLQT